MWSSHATKRPVAYSGLHARQSHRAVVLHTNGGGTDNGSLFGWWSGCARGDQGSGMRHVGAHFQVMTNGHAEQYVDTDLVIYHAFGASEFAVGIETEDDSHPERPWTGPQVQTIIAICRELHVPAASLKDGPSDGVGWHAQYGDWNQSGHDCPGSVREAQIRNVILPALATPPAPKPKKADMKLIIKPGSKAVYSVPGGFRSWIPSKAVLAAMGYTFADVDPEPATSPLWNLPVVGPDAPAADR